MVLSVMVTCLCYKVVNFFSDVSDQMFQFVLDLLYTHYLHLYIFKLCHVTIEFMFDIIQVIIFSLCFLSCVVLLLLHNKKDKL